MITGAATEVQRNSGQPLINGNALFPPSPSRLRLLSAQNRGPGGDSARSEARMSDLDGGENVGDQLDLPAGGCQDGAVAITEGDRTPRAAAPSFRAERRVCAGVAQRLIGCDGRPYPPVLGGPAARWRSEPTPGMGSFW